MMERKWISRKEAADILGCSDQTVSNYANKGMLSMKRSSDKGICLVKKSDVEDLIERMPEIKRIEGSIESHIAGLTMYENELKRRKDDKKINVFFANSFIAEDARRIIELVVRESDATDRDQDIVLSILNGIPLTAIAEYYNLSRERVRQVALRVIRKIRHGFDEMCEDEITIADLTRRNSSLKVANDLQNQKIKELKKLVVMNERYKNEYEKFHDEYYEIKKESVSFKLVNTNLSVRALNCIKTFLEDDMTLYGLLSKIESRKSLLKCRNMGKKTLVEIEELLENIGAKFGVELKIGMWYD